MNMASGSWTVYVPDRSAAFTFDQCVFPTVESVRAALVQNGQTAVGTATATQEGSTIRFARPEGGRKGV